MWCRDDAAASRRLLGDLVDTLLDQGADVNEWAGGTALMMACTKGHADVVRLLIERGADLNAGNKGGDTPLGLAAQYGHVEVVRILVDRGADVDKAMVGLEQRAAFFARDPVFQQGIDRCQAGLRLLDRVGRRQEIRTQPQAPTPPAAGCAKDTDCKGERICIDGTCRAP